MVRQVVSAVGRDLEPSTPLLSSVDFDFVGEGSSGLMNSIHPYPARFIPQIPRALISELSQPGDIVGDVFCGSGTTLVEALDQGRSCIGLDANPIAKVIAEAKIAQASSADLALLEGLESEALAISPQAALDGWRSDCWRPSGPYLSRWFPPHVIEELAECRHLVDGITGNAARIALAALSSIVVKVSWQDSDTRYVRREKGIERGDVLRYFAAALRRSRSASEEFSKRVDSDLHRAVNHGNALAKWPFGTIDALVTSPPYPNAFSYHLYHQTRMLWLGLDQATFKAVEIGSHRKYSAGGQKRATPETFLAEMTLVLARAREHLKPGGYAAFVIGNSTIRGESVDNVAILRAAAAKTGFKLEREIPRNLQSDRKSFNPTIGRIKREWIVVFSSP